MHTKKDIRESIRIQRDALSSREMKRRASMIFANLLVLPAFFRSDVIHTYVSSKNNEVDTHDLIRWMLKERKRVVVPISDTATKHMRHSEIFSLSELSVNSFGIYEPKLERNVKPEEIEVIIVPVLAVDRKGNRIGFGGGFYDRFLHDLQIPSVALAYDFQIYNSIPVEKHDHPVSFIISENEIIRC